MTYETTYKAQERNNLTFNSLMIIMIKCVNHEMDYIDVYCFELEFGDIVAST